MARARRPGQLEQRPSPQPTSQAGAAIGAAIGAATALVAGIAGVDVVSVVGALAVPVAAWKAAAALRATRDAYSGPLPLDLVARCAVDTYVALGELSRFAASSLAIEPRASGYLRCSLGAGRPEDSRRLSDATSEIVSPPPAPRYLVSRLAADPRPGSARLLVRAIRRASPVLTTR
ncbi:MAG TPA: hypothetical protein VMD59_15135 [Acidimicrobiales bacterium]|nr:hypothetical protein [Acidimicrobiales bacterium]